MLEMRRRDEFPWGSMEWLAEGEDKGVSLARMTVRANMTSPLHRHGNCNEVIHLLAGATAQRRGGEWIDMKAGDTVAVYAGDWHQTRNDGAGEAVMMIAYSSGARAYEEAEE